MDEKSLERMKEEFIANISHELRTPLAIAKGSIELVLEEGLSEEQRRILTRGKENLDKLNRIIGNLIEAAQLAENPPPEIEEVDVLGLLSACLSDLSTEAVVRDVEINSTLSEDLPRIRGDKKKLQKAFSCILENAIKFNRRGGRVFVRARAINGSVVVDFKDEGIGVPRECRDRIFDAFFQVDGSSRRRYDGMGLGLAIAKQIVSLHGGEILVGSRRKRGSTFRVVLPCR